jgi:hypothetical protein
MATTSKEHLLDFRICKQLNGVTGDELFCLTKSQLVEYCGKDEGHRLDSQLTVQKIVSGVSANLVLITFVFGCWIEVCLTRAFNYQLIIIELKTIKN